MADILVKSLAYLLVTNNYVIPFLPVIFGKFQGDQYYALIKYMFFFGITFLITYLIFLSHNSSSIKPDDLKNSNLSIHDVSLNDALTIMVIVFVLYFVISMWMPVQLLKLEFDFAVNSILIITSFAIIGSIYAAITDSNIKFKTVSGTKNIVLCIILLVLFVLYTLFDDAIAGTIPGLNLIPPQIKQILNLSLKISNLKDGNTAVVDQLKTSLNGIVTDAEFDRLLYLTKLILDIVPKPAMVLIDKFKSKTALLDKLLGPINFTHPEQMKKFVENPLIKLFLNFDPTSVAKTIDIGTIATGIATNVASKAIDTSSQVVDKISNNIESVATTAATTAAITATTATTADVTKTAINGIDSVTPSSGGFRYKYF